MISRSLFLALVIFCGTAEAAPSYAYRVEKSCTGVEHCYASVQAALNAAGTETGWVTIKLGAGDFYEKVNITRPKTTLKGEGVGRTRLYFDAVAQTAGKYHRANWGTPGSATLTIDADEVKVEALTVENTFDYLSNDALPDNDPKKIGNSQAAALLLDIHSDRVSIRDAALLGYQDTLFANGARAFIDKSLIAGNVDFIFGNGQLLIQDSELRTRKRGAKMAAGETQSFLLAPSTQLSQAIGIVVYRSRLTRDDGVPDNTIALARPWHPTSHFPDGRYADPNAVGYASFIDCFMDAHIKSQHWDVMAGTARDGTKTAIFRPEDSRFAESGSTGPGARHTDQAIRWKSPLSIQEVRALLFKDWPQP
ncbi:pectinesterase [Rhizomicrobium palustre]|uniref:Pectinesterase n=1 Tax=Rhizomicrobium palustre TaxID=189966 RepID=A0A846MW96_9PROT|nr:pectinesterase family protein [Rhizomicrobium palustre]NIK87431.1 pectinesterase [Rhizomicrobium palustre]